MIQEPLFSDQWHCVREVCPRLASDVTVSRHSYRGRATYILHRATVADFHRLDAMSFALVERLDGVNSVGSLWEQALVDYDANAPTQDQWIKLLAELHAAELIVVDQRVTEQKLFERRQSHKISERRQRYLNPLYLRFSLHDPDRWLTRLKPFAERMFSPAVGIAWVLMMLLVLLGVLTHAEALWASISDPSIISADNLLLVLLIYPCLKLLHECAHALAVKRAGGEVHEMGIALMILLPLPYVDASASAMFTGKHERILVSAAGILVELTCAAFGAALWINTGGVFQDIGLIMFLLGGVSTLVFNGNPLLKFDGYYMLADWLEIPNLAARSSQKLLDFFKSVLTGQLLPSRRVEDRAERLWLYTYGILSTTYRTFLMLAIAWILSDRWLLFGLLLAVFIVFVVCIKPLLRFASALIKDPAYHTSRCAIILGIVPALLLICAAGLPLPHASVVPGVVWVPDDAVIRVSSECEIVKVYARPGAQVRAGDKLFVCDDADLRAGYKERLARVDELRARRASAATIDPLAITTIDAELKASKAAVADSRKRLDETIQTARLDGLFDVVGTSALRGRSLKRGEVLGYVIPSGERTVRTVIDERWIARFDQRLESVQLRIAGAGGRASVYDTVVVQRTPKATRRVASAALSTVGGGIHEADAEGNGRLLRDPVFDVELQWPESAGAAAVGSHVSVRLVYSPTPLLSRINTSLRMAMAERVAS